MYQWNRYGWRVTVRLVNHPMKRRAWACDVSAGDLVRRLGRYDSLGAATDAANSFCTPPQPIKGVGYEKDKQSKKRLL